MVVIVMGPAGAGKTTVGSALARQLGWVFLEADEFHPAGNIEQMRNGVPLTDAEREPWLRRVRDATARETATGRDVVVACSALRQRYRDQLALGLPDVRWAYLVASPSLLRDRLASRRGHFAGPDLLASQLTDLEAPSDAITVDAAQPVAGCVARIREAIAR